MGQNPDPVRAMSAAQDSFNGMFSSLNGALTKYQNQQLEQENKLKSDNLEKFYADASSRYATPEAFQAALASGELQGLASIYGDAIDKSKVREFSETRGDVLRQREQDQWKYKDALEKRNATPFVDDIRSRIAAGDFETANALLAENTLPDEASLYEALKQGQTNATKEAYEAQIRPLELESKRLGLDTSRINKDLNQLNLENVQDQRTIDGALSKAYLAAQGTMMQNGLPNESAMTTAATVATEGMDPRIGRARPAGPAPGRRDARLRRGPAPARPPGRRRRRRRPRPRSAPRRPGRRAGRSPAGWAASRRARAPSRRSRSRRAC